MKQSFYIIILLLIGCNSISREKHEVLNSKADIIDKKTPSEVVKEKTLPQKKLYLNGIYEFDYPYDTEGMNENQYIAFQKVGDALRAWYFGTTDEFDEAREGYLPGYFVAQIENLTTKGDSIFFIVTTTKNQFYKTRPPIGFIDQSLLSRKYEKWIYNNRTEEINYSGKLDGLNLYIKALGEERTYKKTRNYFHPGIDNYDISKCRIEPLVVIDQNLNNLTDKMVLDFLNTFSVICEANVEFGEWSNELLFKILSSNPELTLKVLSNNLNNLDTLSIYQELESPLNDLISIDSITMKIEPLNIDKQVKNSVLGRLQK